MKALLIICMLLLSCAGESPTVPKPLPASAILGSYSYGEIIVDFKPGGIYELSIGLDAHKGVWYTANDLLCMDGDCEPVRAVTEAGFEWHDNGLWNYWRKI